MSSVSTLGAVIKARRLELGWTQEELAERISPEGQYVRQSEISRIEGGKIALPRRERLERIALALELPLGELLARSGWAGANEYFAQPMRDTASNDAVSRDEVIAQAPLANGAVANGAVANGGDVANSQAGIVRRLDRDAMNALDNALSTMRAELERLHFNREQSYVIGRRATEVGWHTPEAAYPGGYPEATNS